MLVYTSDISSTNLTLVDRDHQASRRYPKFYKTVLALRQQIRSSGFLIGFDNKNLPFYSSDLKQELHSDRHNFKLAGEEVWKSIVC